MPKTGNSQTDKMLALLSEGQMRDSCMKQILLELVTNLRLLIQTDGAMTETQTHIFSQSLVKAVSACLPKDFKKASLPEISLEDEGIVEKFSECIVKAIDAYIEERGDETIEKEAQRMVLFIDFLDLIKNMDSPVQLHPQFQKILAYLEAEIEKSF